MAIVYEPSGNGITLTLSADPYHRLDRTVTLHCFVGCAADTPIDAHSVAYLRFVLPSEAVVASDDPAATRLAALVPGSTLGIERVVRIHTEDDDCTLRFQAVIADCGGLLARSNVVTLDVRRRAQLSGARTFVRIEPTGNAREVDIIAQLYNHGDGAAQNITLDVPPPNGTHVADAATATARTFGRIAPGELQTIRYVASIVTADGLDLHVSDAALSDASGRCVGLPPASLQLDAAFVQPLITLSQDRRRFHVQIRGTNDGWGAARDVMFALQWPHEFECNVASLQYNAASVGRFDRLQAFVRAEVEPGRATVIVAAIDAGAAYELDFDLYPQSGATDGPVEVALHAGRTIVHAQADVRWATPADVALRITGETDCAAAARPSSIELELANTGDRHVRVTLDVEGARAEFHAAGNLVPAGEEFCIAAGDRLSVRAHLSVSRRSTAQRLAVAFVVRDACREVARRDWLICVRPSTISDETPEWAGPLAVAATASSAEPATFGPKRVHSAASVRFVLALDAARIERCLQLLRASIPATIAGHVCALRAFLPAAARNGDANLQALLRTACDAHETALERLALHLRMPGGDRHDRHVLSATVAPTVGLFEAVIAGGEPAGGAGTPWPDRAYLSVAFSRMHAQQLLDVLRQASSDGRLLTFSLALMPCANTGCAPIGAALETYVRALRSADPGARGPALDRIETQRRGLIDALVQAQAAYAPPALAGVTGGAAARTS